MIAGRKRKAKIPKIPKAEQSQIELRRALGHAHALKTDEYGRQRIGVGFGGEPYDLDSEDITADGEQKLRFSRADPVKMMLRRHKRRGGIEYQLFRAAECIRLDFARLESNGVRVSAFFERVDSSSAPYVPVAAIEAATKLRAILEDLRPIELMLIHKVVVLYQPVSELEKQGLGDQRYLAPRLKEALERVAVHYGLMSKPKGETNG